MTVMGMAIIMLMVFRCQIGKLIFMIVASVIRTVSKMCLIKVLLVFRAKVSQLHLVVITSVMWTHGKTNIIEVLEVFRI